MFALLRASFALLGHVHVSSCEEIYSRSSSQSVTSMQKIQVSAENAGKFMFLQLDHQKGLFLNK